MRDLIAALCLMLAAPVLAQDTPTPTNTPTATPTNTPTNTPTATQASVATPVADAEVSFANARKRLTAVAIADGTAVGVIGAPGDAFRTVVHSATISSTAAASVTIRIGTALYTVHMGAGIPYSLPEPLYGQAGQTVIMQRTAGSAAVNAILWTTTDPVR